MFNAQYIESVASGIEIYVFPCFLNPKKRVQYEVIYQDCIFKHQNMADYRVDDIP